MQFKSICFEIYFNQCFLTDFEKSDWEKWLMNSRSRGASTLYKNTLFQGGICYECQLMCIVHMFSMTFFTSWSSPNLEHNMIPRLECSEVIVSKCMECLYFTRIYCSLRCQKFMCSITHHLWYASLDNYRSTTHF